MNREAVLQFEQDRFYTRLIWLFPIAFAFHVVEESLGFARWVNEILQGQMDVSIFYINNAAFMLILLSLCIWAARSKSRAATLALFLWVSGQQFWNFVFHLYTQYRFRFLSPGLFTATFLYFPIFLYLSYLALRDARISMKAWLGCIVAGAFGMWFTIWAGLYHFAPFPWDRWLP